MPRHCSIRQLLKQSGCNVKLQLVGLPGLNNFNRCIFCKEMSHRHQKLRSLPRMTSDTPLHNHSMISNLRQVLGHSYHHNEQHKQSISNLSAYYVYLIWPEDRFFFAGCFLAFFVRPDAAVSTISRFLARFSCRSFFFNSLIRSFCLISFSFPFLFLLLSCLPALVPWEMQSIFQTFSALSFFCLPHEVVLVVELAIY